MSPADVSRPVELIPPARQAVWGRPAVANFVLGGLGAGLYVVAALAAGFQASPTLRIASWLGPVLVLVGFAAAAPEAGRPLRGPRVLARVRISWMSRELALGGVFAALAGADLTLGAPELRLLAAATAVLLALAQGFILQGARGVPAWSVPVMPPLFLTSALASGAGLLVLLEVARGRVSPRLLGGTLVLLTLHLIVWWTYITWSRDEAFLGGVRALREGRGALAIVGAGYLAPSLLLALGVAVPALAPPLAAAGAGCVIVGQLYAKAGLVLRAGHLRPITLAHPRLERRSR
jgi:DMSO reductase anchor subunit